MVFSIIELDLRGLNFYVFTRTPFKPCLNLRPVRQAGRLSSDCGVIVENRRHDGGYQEIVLGDVVSLKHLRKKKERALKEAQANANRIRFGRKKSEKDSARAQTAKAERHLDNHALTAPSMREGHEI